MLCCIHSLIKFRPSTPTGAIGAKSKPSHQHINNYFVFSQDTHFLQGVGEVELLVGASHLLIGEIICFQEVLTGSWIR